MVALVSKLTNEFCNHYQKKLLSVATGSYDDYLAPRYQGKSKSKGEIGFKIPTGDVLSRMQAGLTRVGENLYSIPSETAANSVYIVDTFMGHCECPIGRTGAACKHQFIVWKTLQLPNPNFVPYFNDEQRMRIAQIAIGESATFQPEIFAGLRTNQQEPVIPEAIVHVETDHESTSVSTDLL